MFYKINKSFMFDNYFKLNRKEIIDPHSNEGFTHQIYNTEKFLLEQYNKSLII